MTDNLGATRPVRRAVQMWSPQEGHVAAIENLAVGVVAHGGRWLRPGPPPPPPAGWEWLRDAARAVQT